MEINDLLKIGREKLKDRDYTDPLLEARLLLSHALKVDSLYVYINGKEEVDGARLDLYLDLLEKRSSGYPLQYILNEANFMGLDFYVEEGVLIPRSDTEVLVEFLLDYIDSLKRKDVRLLDIGIGSGAIVLSTAYHKPFIQAYGVDLMDKPIEITKRNIEAFDLDNVEIYQGDLFAALEGEEFYSSFDIIASNPPYINSREMEGLQDEVRDHEPWSALDGGEDGLDFYRRIVREARSFLKKDGLLIFEIGHDQGERVSRLMLDHGYRDIRVLTDIQKLDRVVLGYI